MSICKRVSAAVVCIIFLLLPKASHAFIDPTGPVQVAYLAKILIENIKHYYQLQQMIQRAQSHEDFLRLVNSGIENSIGLLNALPVKDEKILADIRDFKKAFDAVTEIYGKVPKSKEQALQLLNDQTVAESMRMANSFKSYSEEQERNSLIIASQSREASPKGAVRMQAETSAHILRSLSQLIRLNTQMLKLQSEQLALNNKSGKDQVMGFQRAEQSLGDGFKNLKMDTNLARF